MTREKPKTAAEKADEIAAGEEAAEEAAEKTKYQPTARERAALDKQRARMAAEPPTPRLKIERDDGTSRTVSLDHPDLAVASALLKEAVETTDVDFVQGLFSQLANREIDEGELNFMFAVIKDVKPNDQCEAMLAAQMAVVHAATLSFARQLGRTETSQQQDSTVGALNKLARTFAMQMETLKRYRTGGEQKVTVQHVSVSEGGQAIVGNVTQAAPKTAPEKPADNTPALTDARQPAMPIIESKRARVPVRRRHKNDGQSSA